MSTQNANAGKKKLILNAFVEMCMSPKVVRRIAIAHKYMQAADISPPDCGGIPTTSPPASATSTTGLS